MEIDKNVTNNEYLIICEECFAEWKNPQDALKNVNGRRGFEEGKIRSATFDEIKSLGWDEFVVNGEIATKRTARGNSMNEYFQSDLKE